MVTTRKTAVRKAGAPRKTGGVAKAKVMRVARQAQAALEETAHDAGIALRRTAR